MKCSRPTCSREAEGRFRWCLTCRQNDVELRRRRVARGQCRECEQPRLIGYNRCHCCEIKNVLGVREIRNTVIRGDLYVMKTPRGIKVGRSERLEKT